MVKSGAQIEFEDAHNFHFLQTNMALTTSLYPRKERIRSTAVTLGIRPMLSSFWGVLVFEEDTLPESEVFFEMTGGAESRRCAIEAGVKETPRPVTPIFPGIGLVFVVVVVLGTLAGALVAKLVLRGVL